MKILVNGDPRQVPDGYTPQRLLEDIGLAGRRVAMEINLEIVPRSGYGSYVFQDGDRVEVVHAIGGGAGAAL